MIAGPPHAGRRVQWSRCTHLGSTHLGSPGAASNRQPQDVPAEGLDEQDQRDSDEHGGEHGDQA